MGPHHLSTVVLLFLLDDCAVAVVLLVRLLVHHSDIREVLHVPIVPVGVDHHHPDGRDVDDSTVGAMGQAHDHGPYGPLERDLLLLDLDGDPLEPEEEPDVHCPVRNVVPIGRGRRRCPAVHRETGVPRWDDGLDSKRTLPWVHPSWRRRILGGAQEEVPNVPRGGCLHLPFHGFVPLDRPRGRLHVASFSTFRGDALLPPGASWCWEWPQLRPRQRCEHDHHPCLA